MKHTATTTNRDQSAGKSCVAGLPPLRHRARVLRSRTSGGLLVNRLRCRGIHSAATAAPDHAGSLAGRCRRVLNLDDSPRDLRRCRRVLKHTATTTNRDQSAGKSRVAGLPPLRHGARVLRSRTSGGLLVNRLRCRGIHSAATAAHGRVGSPGGCCRRVLKHTATTTNRDQSAGKSRAAGLPPLRHGARVLRSRTSGGLPVNRLCCRGIHSAATAAQSA